MKATEEQKQKMRAYYLANKEQRIAKIRIWQLANPERRKKYYTKAKLKWRERQFGLGDGFLSERFQAKPTCDLCGEPFYFGGRSTRNPVVDHNHETGKVRGILHRSCNLGIGCFTEKPEILMKAVAYLEKP